MDYIYTEQQYIELFEKANNGLRIFLAILFIIFVMIFIYLLLYYFEQCQHNQYVALYPGPNFDDLPHPLDNIDINNTRF